jgi:hypothetical protein
MTNKMERLNNTQWKVYQNIMLDPGKFLDQLHSIEWEEGLHPDVYANVDEYLNRGAVDVDADGGPTKASKREENTEHGISVAMARYASEDAVLLVHFAIAIMEYTKAYLPYKFAKEKVEQTKSRLADFEKNINDRRLEVCNNTFFSKL